jgi:hypothetical protein
VGYVSSSDGGAHWGNAIDVAGPMTLDQIAPTSQGPMVGDYISTSFNDSGTATALIALGLPRTGNTFREGMWAPATPFTVATAPANTATTSGANAGQGVGAAQQAIRKD